MKKVSNLLAIILLMLAFVPAGAQNFNMQLLSSKQYAGQTLANVCGYAADGREYALLGGSKGLIIEDVTVPTAPVTIVQIPGPDNLWKEIKTYSHYAYVTSEGGGGVQIVDMSTLPSANVVYKNYTGDGEINGQLGTIHALHIDVKKGFLYAYGSSLFQGGAVVLSLEDPYNPVYVGKFNQLGYIHDGYADNDTLYAAHIYDGLLSIVDMTDKANPVLISTVETPGKFTHNAWLLDDHKHILTTDEAFPSFVAAYDITDPTDIKELDRLSTNDGNSSIGHNTHVLNDYAITSWYTDGFNILDAHRPDNLVFVASYDTWPGGGQFDGCWGVYPYLPSGNIIATNIEVGQMFVVAPTYQRACYLEGNIMDGCNNLPLSGVTIDVSGNDPYIDEVSGSNGDYKTGQVTPGTFTVTFSKAGYTSQTQTIVFATATVTNINLVLEPLSASSVTGLVVDAATQAPLANIPVVVSNATASYTLQTNASGQFVINCALSGDYQVTAGIWGYESGNATIGANGNITISLDRGYYDNFSLDYGWTSTGDASSGDWERGEPVGTSSQGNASNPDFDVTNDAGDECFVTGNGGGGAGSDDVDNGNVFLTSPAMDLSQNTDGLLTFAYWFHNAGGQGTPPNDKFEVKAISDGQEAILMTETVSASEWRNGGVFNLKDYIPMSNDVRIQFSTGDLLPGHLVEAAVDVFRVVPTGSVNTHIVSAAAASMTALPNPSSDVFSIQYQWIDAKNITLEVSNILGQIVEQKQLSANTGMIQVGNTLPKGVYVAVLKTDKMQSLPVRLIKE